jgi:hypothetical protein
MRQIAVLLACAALVGCGATKPSRRVDQSRLAAGQTAAIVRGQPAIVDRDGAVVRTIDLSCRGFVLQHRLHKCTDPSVQSVAVSADRRLLAYTRVLDGLDGLEPWREIGVVGVDGSRQRTVVKARPSAMGGVSDVSWADTGRHLLFVSDQQLLESVRIDGTDRRPLGHVPPRPPAPDAPGPAGLADP